MGGRRAADPGLGWAGLVDVEPDADAPSNLDGATDVDAPAGHDAALAAIIEGDEPDTLPQHDTGALVKGLVLPSPEPQARPNLPVSPVAPPAVRGFSASKLVEKLEAKPVEVPTSWWREYREVLLTVGVGAIVLAGYLALRAPAEPTVEEPSAARTVAAQRLEAIRRSRAGGLAPTSDSPTPPEAPVPQILTGGGTTRPVEAPAAEPRPVIQPASTPLLSILSDPAGAVVEIDGQPAGKTPLIGPSPAKGRALQIKLTHADCKPWEQALLPNDAGHYEARIEMVPLRGVRR